MKNNPYLKLVSRVKANIKSIAVCILPFSMLLTGCGPGQLFGPTTTPSLTPTLTPTATLTATPTLTPTPVPVCNPGTTVEGAMDNGLLGHLDILNVSTTLVGTNLTAIFTVREIPDEITIDRSILQTGIPDVAWGVAVDTDNNPDTGGPSFLTKSGYGYDFILQAFNFNKGSERNGSIQNLFRYKTNVWTIKADGGISSGPTGTLIVDQISKTIALAANIRGITQDSYLQFFTFYKVSNEPNDSIVDELCGR